MSEVRPGLQPTLLEITHEFFVELQDMLKRSVITDTIFPPLVYITTYASFGLQTALVISTIFCGFITIVRLYKGQSVIEALTGVLGVCIALVVTYFFPNPKSYYIPGIILYGVIALLCGISVFSRWPFLVWTSRWYRNWPWEWYQHPGVLPVYKIATLYWAVFFTVRTIVQLFVYAQFNVYALATIDFITGWPTTIVLLYITLVFGRRKFIALGGPSVDEFITKKQAPFLSQRSGF